MGYNTEYTGRFELSRVLTYEEIDRIEDWNSRRHEGYGPSIWCGWSIGYGRAMKNYLVVDIEKSHGIEQAKWLQYMVNEGIVPNDVDLLGQVDWEGEEYGDMGIISFDNDSREVLISLAEIKFFKPKPVNMVK